MVMLMPDVAHTQPYSIHLPDLCNVSKCEANGPSPPRVSMPPLTCEHSVNELRVRLVFESAEGGVGDALHDALGEDAAHLRVIGAREVAD